MAKKQEKKTWANTDANRGMQWVGSKERPDGVGTYIGVIESAWDSFFAPAGTTDAEKKQKKPDFRYFGWLVKVVWAADDKSPQIGRYQGIKLWMSSDKAIEMTKAALEAAGMTFNEEVTPDDPLSVKECIGQYIRFTVDAESYQLNEGEPNEKTQYRHEVKPWNIFEPGNDEYVNNERELTADPENEISVEHYKKELSRANSSSGDGEGESDIPF